MTSIRPRSHSIQLATRAQSMHGLGPRRAAVHANAVLARHAASIAAGTLQPVASTSRQQGSLILAASRRSYISSTAKTVSLRLPVNPRRSASCFDDTGAVLRHPRTGSSSCSSSIASTPPCTSLVKASSSRSRRSLHTSRIWLEQSNQNSAHSSALDSARSTSVQETKTSSNSSSSSDSSPASTSSSDKTDNEVPKSPKDVSLGEVRRLLSLAKPEKRTLYTALGLVSLFLDRHVYPAESNPSPCLHYSLPYRQQYPCLYHSPSVESSISSPLLNLQVYPSLSP